MTRDRLTLTPGTTYRGQCACGWRFGFADDITARPDVETAHRAHARSERRKDDRAGIHTSHALTVLDLTGEQRLLEAVNFQRGWITRLADTYIPDRKAQVADRAMKIAAGLRSAADDVERYVGHLASGASVYTASAYTPDYVAAQVQHTVLWAVANLNLAGLTSSVSDYRDAQRDLASSRAELLEAEAILARHEPTTPSRPSGWPFDREPKPAVQAEV